MLRIVGDFITELCVHWLAFLAGSAPMTALAVAANFTKAIQLPLWAWAVLVFVFGLLTASFKLYYDLRSAIGTGLKPLPNLSLRNAVVEILGSAEWAMFDEMPGRTSGDLQELLDEFGTHAASGDITIWAATSPLGRFGPKNLLAPVPAEHWRSHRISIISFLRDGSGEIENLAGDNVNRLYDVTLNAAQIKIFHNRQKQKSDR